MQELTQLELLPAAEILAWARSEFGGAFAVATSFQREGMAVLDMASKIGPGLRVFTLDTGRLPDETYQMIETVRRQYGITVEVVFPDREEVERLVSDNGPNLFYRSVEDRSLCCEVRKVRPLERKLAELRAWATGLRRSQGASRAAVRKLEEAGGRIKINPLADWSAEQVERYLQANGVPEHPLYERGYASIGCEPCTRAIHPGEDERAGRWWWEQGANKECGIHFSPGGSVRRGASEDDHA